MIKKARERVGRLYKLRSFEEDKERLENVEGLLRNHAYTVRQCDRMKAPEVRFSQCLLLFKLIADGGLNFLNGLRSGQATFSRRRFNSLFIISFFNASANAASSLRDSTIGLGRKHHPH